METLLSESLITEIFSHLTHGGATGLKNLFEILLNLPEIRLDLPFSDGFGTKRTSVRLQINRKMVNTI